MSSLIRIRYAPEGASEQTWLVDLENPAWDLNTQTEKVTGDAWMDLVSRIGKKSYEAQRAVLWVLRKRMEPRLEFASVRFEYGTDFWIEDPDDDPDSPTYIAPAQDAGDEDPKEN